MDQDCYERGLAMRRKVLGEAYVDKQLKGADDFNRDFQRHRHPILLGRGLGRRHLSVRASGAFSISA